MIHCSSDSVTLVLQTEILGRTGLADCWIGQRGSKLSVPNQFPKQPHLSVVVREGLYERATTSGDICVFADEVMK